MHLSTNSRLDKLLKTVLSEVKLYAEDQIKHIKKNAEISLALSGNNNLNELFEKIVDLARELTNADGGTLYTVDDSSHHLCFKIMQNETLKTRKGGTSSEPITLPKVPLYINNNPETPNHSNVSSHVAVTGKIINIPDVYKAEGFDFSGARRYDAATNYNSKSMLVIPLQNHENKIIGVLQLLNARHLKTQAVIPFSSEYVVLIRALASQAAIALTNAQLIHDLKTLFEAFIKSIATAIDKKSPYTGGHVRRVVDITMMIAQAINTDQTGKFKDVSFNSDQLEELRLSAWMHDVGKITTPEFVVDKAAKLETIFNRIELIETRFHLIAQLIEKQKLQELWDDFNFIKTCNASGEFMPDEDVARINRIAATTYQLNGSSHPYLTADERHNLCIRKGNLTNDERQTIENHAEMTGKILEELPFPERLKNVPFFAAGHHEKMNGSGYPLGLKNGELPLQMRIMAVADIFEALTAKDRPYKKPMSLSQAIKILGFMKKDHHIDPDVYELFLNSKLHLQYSLKELNPDQIDLQ